MATFSNINNSPIAVTDSLNLNNFFNTANSNKNFKRIERDRKTAISMNADVNNILKPPRLRKLQSPALGFDVASGAHPAIWQTVVP